MDLQEMKEGKKMEEKIRGAKPQCYRDIQNNKTAEKIARLLAESKTTFSDVDNVFRIVKEKLSVTY